MKRATLLTAGLVALLGCDKKPSEEANPKPPPPKVNLPPSPDMTEAVFAEKYADGSWSVSGLVKNRSRLFGRAVSVKGQVLSLKRCTDPEDCDPPEHALLVDDTTRPAERLVVLGGEGTPFATLEQGQSVVLSGDYLDVDPKSVFVRLEGVLLLHRDLPPEGAPPAEEPAPAAPAPEGAVAPPAPAPEGAAAPAPEGAAAPAPEGAAAPAPEGAVAPAVPAQTP